MIQAELDEIKGLLTGFETNYEIAGTAGAFDAGQNLGKIVGKTIALLGAATGVGGVVIGTSKIVGKVVKSVNKVKALKVVNTQKQVVRLFDKNSGINSIKIGSKEVTALPKSGGAKVFEGVSDKQVMTYFKQLTGGKLPKKEFFTIKNKKTGEVHTGTIYKVVDKNGNKFTLRNLSSSKVNNGTTERWTIDVPEAVHGLKGFKGFKGIKFK